MKFSTLAEYFEKIEQTPSRLSMTHYLAELFKKLKPEEIEKAAYLLQGRVLPLFEKVEFGMAEKMVIKAIVYALQIEKNMFEKEFRKRGDLGKALEQFKQQYVSFEQNNLSLLEVYEELYKLATASGDKSQELKIRILSSLIRQLDPLSCRYLVRIPQGTMRMGFSDMTVLDAYSWMVTGDKSKRTLIEQAYHVRPDLGYIGRTIKEKGIEALNHMQPRIFTPIIMMKAERLSSGKEIINQIGKCALEPKYDGFRLQIHVNKDKNEVRLYSRNLEEVSLMYPDIIKGIQKEVKGKEVILEGEAIGFDPHSGKFLPFQETVQRKRKYDITKKAKEIPLKFFAFELLYKDGINYIHEPFETRRKILETIIKTSGNSKHKTILLAPETIVSDERTIEHMFEEAIREGLEGIIAKKMDGVYQPGARAWNWIKLKRSYSSKIHDTIDCLVMGYDFGKGKRVDFGIGAFLVGVYDEKKSMFVTMAKIGTGLTDEEWRELKVRCTTYKLDKKPALYDVDKQMNADMWTKPTIVVEIKADEITRSPVHTAGRILKPSKSGNAMEVHTAGFALRFPRLQKFRDDKRPEDVTTLKEIEEMFKKQGKSGNSKI